MTFIAYDHTQSSNAGPFVGRPLATNQTQLQFTAGKTTTYSVALDGIPAYFTISPNGNGYLQGSRTGLTLYGGSTQQVLVVSLDRDGNPIIGPGAPVIKLAPSTSSLTVTPIGTSNPNVFSLRAKTTGTPPVVTPGLLNLIASASQPSSGGAGAVTTTVPLRIAHSVIVGSSGAGLGEYFDGNTAPSIVLNTAGLVAMNNSGNVFVGSGLSVNEYPAAQSSSTLSISLNGTDQNGNYGGVSGLGIDAFDSVTVTQNYEQFDSIQFDAAVSKYPSGSTSGKLYFDLGSVKGLAVDAVGGRYESIFEYSDENPGTYYIFTPLVTFQTTDNPGAIAVDGRRTIYVDLPKGVTEFPAGQSTPTMTLPSHGQPSIDAAGNVYIGNVEYAAGSTTPLRTFNFTVFAVLPSSAFSI